MVLREIAITEIEKEIEMVLPLIANSFVERVGPWLQYMTELRNLRAQVRQERKILNALDDHQLRDIGVSREEARREARRAIHDVPSHRHPARPSVKKPENAADNPLMMIRLG